jgi:hypothetical protein
MIKQFSTLETLRILLDHKKVMFDVIRKMDSSGDRYINEAQMAVTVLDHMSQLDSVEQQRVQIAFSTDNLLQTHVLADKDTYNGVTRLIFQEAVVGLFRLCDASLYQELTDSKLKSRLAGLWRVQERYQSGTLSFYEGDPDYTELVDDTFEQLSMLLDVLKRNVVRMKSLSQDFESLSTEACKDPQTFARFRENLLVQVTTLFERHIKPTQSFLNHNIRLQEGDNLFDTLNSIKLVFERNDKIEKADQIFRFSLSFSSIFKPITVVAHQVDQFLRKTRASMAQFNAMEHHFQLLTGAYEQTLERNLNKTKIDTAYAKSFDFINGLKKNQRPKDLRISDSPSYFANLFAEIEIRLDDNLSNTLPNDDVTAWQSEENSNKLKRSLAIYDYLSTVTLRATDDLTAALHYRLKDVFDDYHLMDLLSAVTRMRKQPDDFHLRTTNKKTYISHDEQVFVYRRKRLIDKTQFEES